MSSQVQVLLSNQTEALYEGFKEQLFACGTNSFTKRIVIVPSKAMKKWLSFRLVEDLGIAAGIEFYSLEPAMRILEKTLGQNTCFHLPPRMELALQIEAEIRCVLKEEKDPLWEPIRAHLLNQKNGSLTRKGDKRLVALSDQLAALFAQYEKYGKRMLRRWMEESSLGWQETLWKRVVGKTESGAVDWTCGNVSVHLFALSYLSQEQHRKLCALAEKIPVRYYLLSPCELFWSDLLSDRENSRLIQRWEKQGMSQEALEEATELLFERNPLLANWGKLGRLMAAQIEESLFQVEEEYKEHQDETCCLHALQMDLLKLRAYKHLPKREFADDESIQIHVSPSKTREVQVLYHTLLGIIDRHADGKEKIDPNDIIVMAPNIKAYEPMIRAVFRSPQSQLDCQIMDLNVSDCSDVIKGFFHLIALSETRWENEALLNLFSFQAFQERHAMTESQVEKLRTWIRKSGIRWGVDAEHRSELLLRSHCERGMMDTSSAGTWKMGIDRMLLGTAMLLPLEPEEQARHSRRPLHAAGAGDHELLGMWASWIRSLREDLKPLSGGAKKTVKEWADYLLFLLFRYFSWEKTEEGKTEASKLIACIEGLKAEVSAKDARYPFSTIVYHLNKAIEHQEVHYRESHVQSVRFSSMLPVQAVPSKVVVLMGISEENFPRIEERAALNQLYHQEGADPFPNATEFDRYLFLEALLSARQYLILSYHTPEKGKEPLHQGSLLISELIHYLDQSFLISGKKPSESCVYTHPFFPFDKRYFQKGEKIRSFSRNDYCAALSHYTSSKEASDRFFSPFTAAESDVKRTGVVDLKEVKGLARNPVRFYFHKQLGIYLEETEEVQSDEMLAISPLDLSNFRKRSWRLPPEPLLNGASLEGKIPVGPFKDLSMGKITKEFSDAADHMQAFSIESGDLFEVVLCETCKVPRREEKRWVFPPLAVEGESFSYTLVGSLGECSTEGLVADKKGEPRDIAELWPLYLIWCRLIEESGKPFKKELLFARSGIRKEACFETSLPLLKAYMQYFSCASYSLSPLIPDWAEPFAMGTIEDLRLAIKKSVEGEHFFNDEVKWLCREGEGLQADLLYANWAGKAKELFSIPFQQWRQAKK